jgi:hypothetical protein
VLLKDLLDRGPGADVIVYSAEVHAYDSIPCDLKNEDESRSLGKEGYGELPRGEELVRVGVGPSSIDSVQLSLADPLPRVDLVDPQMAQISAEHWHGLDKGAVCLALKAQRLSEEPSLSCARNRAKIEQGLEDLRVSRLARLDDCVNVGYASRRSGRSWGRRSSATGHQGGSRQSHEYWTREGPHVHVTLCVWCDPDTRRLTVWLSCGAVLARRHFLRCISKSKPLHFGRPGAPSAGAGVSQPYSFDARVFL